MKRHQQELEERLDREQKERDEMWRKQVEEREWSGIDIFWNFFLFGSIF